MPLVLREKETVRLTVDGLVLEAHPDDDLLTTMAKGGTVPAGCLCWGGDCPNCLAVVDGVAYVRLCQTKPVEGMDVSPSPVLEPPPLPETPGNVGGHRQFRHVDMVVIGGGESGMGEASRLRALGHSVVVIEAAEGNEALGIYAGPEVVARLDGEMVRLAASKVIVATGAAEIHPVVPGSHLGGILTRRAASHLGAAGVDLGHLVAVGDAPDGIEAEHARGELVRFEGSERISAVVVADERGNETRYPCDTVSVDLGLYPRDVLARMGQPGEVEAVGDAAIEPSLPLCPADGIVCPCSGVTVEDLDFVWERGFDELELIKRATLAGTGTCQGGVCSPYLRSFVANRGGEEQPTFTARPLARQMTMAEAAAGTRFPPIHRTALDDLHRRNGARMDRMGGWWRPWVYTHGEGDPLSGPDSEYWAVRQGVSLGDVGTLGKMTVRGPDAVEFLERLYPCRVADLKPGRSRYGLVLAESGAVMDDGVISRLDTTTFALSFTTGGASVAEVWVRDWAATFDADVHIMDRTHSLGAINVTGPLATELMSRAGLSEDLSFMSHLFTEIGGVPARIYRLSFTGEISYELHHPVAESERLWNWLADAGADLGVRPHGVDTLLRLRLEKGHIVVGVDTEPDSTPRRLGMEWALKMDKPDFVGKAAVERTNRVPLDRRLVGFTMEGPAPVDGTAVFDNGTVSGYVTSATWSPALSKVVGLAWVHLNEGANPAAVIIDRRTAQVTAVPFYDPGGSRARA